MFYAYKKVLHIIYNIGMDYSIHYKNAYDGDWNGKPPGCF